MSKRLTAKVGEFQKDGATKGRYVNIGAILQNDNGEYLLLDPSINLAGVLIQQNAIKGENRTNVLVSIFSDDRQQASQGAAGATNQAPASNGQGGQNQGGQQGNQQVNNDFDDSGIPF